MGTLQFIGWLKHHLDRRTFEGCVWVNKEQQIFKILWPRADKNLTPEKLGVMFKWWTHKFGSTRNHNQPTAIKGNFRSCLNSKVQSKEIKKLKNMEDSRDADDWKVFQFTENLKDPKNPPGRTKQHHNRRMIPEPNDSEADQERDSAAYDPGEFYADDTIRSDYEDVVQGSRSWKINITAYTRQRTKIWNYVYDYALEDMGKRKLHVYVKGESRKTKILPRFFERYIPTLDFSTVNNNSAIDSDRDEFLKKEFSDATNPQKVFTMQDTFCPGFIFEVDRSFNVFITRLSQSRLYFGHHGEQNQWQKLEKVKNAQSYNETEEHKDGVKQMVFSYKKFIHSAKVYEDWLLKEKPAMDLIDYRVLMPVDTTPRMGMGCDGDCNFYFEIEHCPARAVFNTIRKKEDQEGRGNELFISEDIMAEEFANMGLDDTKRAEGMQYSTGSCAQQYIPPTDVKVKTQPEAPPSYQSQVYINPVSTEPMQYTQFSTFDNPGPNVWGSQQQAYPNMPQQGMSIQQHPQQQYVTGAANLPQQQIDQLFQEKMMKESPGYHAGHLPTSPAQVPDQYPGGYGHQQFMAEMDQHAVQSCESSWSETMSPRSDMTLTGAPSPYMAQVYNEPEYCFKTEDCNCTTCLTNKQHQGLL